MVEFGWVLLAACFPALGILLGSFFAEYLPLSREGESLALHGAAGVILAIVAVEIMPRALAVDQFWIPLGAFFLGSLFFIWLDRLVGLVQARFGENAASTTPWMIYLGVCIDLFSDGLMIGAGATISIQLGFLLAFAQSTADVPEGFATISAFKRHAMAPKKRFLIALSFILPVFLGAVIGYWALQGRAEILQYSVLAFTGGVLFTMTIEEMIPEAHKEEHPRLAALFLSGGFVLFAFFSVFVGD